MLKFILRDTEQRMLSLSKPLRAGIVFSKGAPAAGLTAVFQLLGEVPLVESVQVLQQEQVVFFGYVDEQIEQHDKNGVLLELHARSVEAVLLDNEACPQTYVLPSMPLLMERHFTKAGFREFIGPDTPFNGELVIRKGMSEWEVLSEFCRKFLGTVPRIDPAGVIDITGSRTEDRVIVGGGHEILYVRRKRCRSRLISHLFARTCLSGGYDMHLTGQLAEEYGIRRVRYVNAVSSGKDILGVTERVMAAAEDSFLSYEVECTGGLVCQIGDMLYLEGSGCLGKICELHYRMDNKGEKTKIFTEAGNYVDRKKYGTRQ